MSFKHNLQNGTWYMLKALLMYYVNEALLRVNLVTNQNCSTSFDADLQC
jgi:hypothetical protein